MPDTLKDQAVAARNLAAQAGRLANDQINEAEKAKLVRFAAELEATADDLERRAAESN
jgi:hypothetical protein